MSVGTIEQIDLWSALGDIQESPVDAEPVQVNEPETESDSNALAGHYVEWRDANGRLVVEGPLGGYAALDRAHELLDDGHQRVVYVAKTGVRYDEPDIRTTRRRGWGRRES